ncbi:MAG: hypothetical protein FJ035_08470 [Chloroflexi bacterium]|nr:hypothetical protein [Chloroflexota bacterium]
MTESCELAITIDEVAAAMRAVTSASDARAIVNRASRIAGVPSNHPLAVRKLLMVCEALTAEGGPVQQVAEVLAGHALRPDEGGYAGGASR